MEFEALINGRTSTRSFEKIGINRSILEKILEDATQAPISCNLQHFSFIVLDDQSLINTLCEKVSYKFNYSSCFIMITMQNGLSIKRGAGYTSVGFIADHLILSASNRGLDSLVMAGFEHDKKIKKLLAIPRKHEIVLLIALGKGQDKVGQKPKRVPVENWVGYNTFSPLNIIKTKNNVNKWKWQEVIDYRARIGLVYVDRFRLNTFPGFAYEKVFEDFLLFIDAHSKNLTILDLITYDGMWAKVASEGLVKKRSSNSIHISDFNISILESHKRNLNCNFFVLKNFKENTFSTKFDVITSVFQLNHFPNVNEQLEFCYSLLTTNGRVFIAVHNDSLLKLLLRKIEHLKNIVLGNPVNVYENSTFYRAGPFSNIHSRKLLRILRGSGFFVINFNRIKYGKILRKSVVLIVVGQKLT
jgi:nitroreductase/2-polyprenyl-3-methyl-5-hydroxy-6-metoxy-1,4-benzoquinol methylase